MDSFLYWRWIAKVIEHWSFNRLQVDIDSLKCSVNVPNYKLSDSMLDYFCYTPSLKKMSPSRWSSLCYVQNCVNWNSKTLILSLKNSNFSDFAYCQGGKTISSIWRFDRPSRSSCRLCTALILDRATKTNCFPCKQIVF